ncbi:unnamed protein product [Penicillium nalgiovense]|nr:unnamed protein product [Penicillium nalgiovense]
MTIFYTWWKDATVYQIWPASYKDSNGDGIGDIPGIISKLDYIKELGIDVIWLSPMFDSPQDDMGYDVSDYEAVYPKYGTIEDMQMLIDETHRRGMKLILDLVANHTSAEHKWFQESRSSKTNPKRDWYIWRKPKYDVDGNRQPPNNWLSRFSGSAWKYDETTGEYFLHIYTDTMPDLNWENPETRQAIYDSALKTWFERGVDGFRIDVAGKWSKVQSFSDAPIVFPESKWQPADMYFQHGPRIHEFHKDMVKQVISKYDAMTVGEVGHSTKEEALKYVSAKEKEMNMIFLFHLVNVGSVSKDRYRYSGFDLVDMKKAIIDQDDYFKNTDGWSTVFTENHDRPRSISRFGNESSPKLRSMSGKLLTMLQITLTGTLFLYQGQEIGMTNIPRSWPIEEYLDVEAANYFKAYQEEYGCDPAKLEKLMDVINLLARDNARTPVQWDSTENGGFTTGKPWMRVNDNYKQINAQSQINDPSSILSFWKESLRLRKEYKDLFIYGSLKVLDYDNKQVFTYLKETNSETSYVALNCSSKSVKFKPLITGNFKLICSNIVSKKVDDTLCPYEGRIYIVK